jgi:hypothetical protein
MTEDDKVLVDRLRGKAEWLDPEIDLVEEWEASDAADRIEAQAAEIEKLREALRDIQIEAERERGNWTHLKQVIARKARAALGETK